MVITSKSNPLIKAVSKLYDKKYRRQYGQFLVEGIKPVNECIAADCPIDKIICTEEFEKTYINCVVVSEDVFSSISSEKTPQGVLAIVNMPCLSLKKPESSCLLLDNLQDPGNLGTIIRTANAAGYKQIYLINCTDAFSPKAVRASMSGIFFTQIYTGEREEILGRLADVPLICADMNGENIFDFEPPEKFCLCIGNEGNGISEEILASAAHKVKIPMCVSCESLNAAVSAGIAMYQLKYGK